MNQMQAKLKHHKSDWKKDAGGGKAYIDGGMVANNPIMYAVAESTKLWPDRHIACIHSFGTGTLPEVASASGSVLGWASTLLGPPNNDEQLWRQAVSTVRHLEALRHNENRLHAMRDIPPASMVRINPPGMAGTYKAFNDNKAAMKTMRREVDEYIALPNVQLMLATMAKDLDANV